MHEYFSLNSEVAFALALITLTLLVNKNSFKCQTDRKREWFDHLGDFRKLGLFLGLPAKFGRTG